MSGSARDLQALAQRSADADLPTLIQVKEKARAAMTKDQSAKNIAAFNAAAKALENAMQQKGQDQAQDPPASSGLASIQEVIRYIEGLGFVGTKSVYRHKSEGKLRPNEDGTYSKEAVKKYAEVFLKQRATGLKKSEDATLQQRQLLTAREELLREQTLLARRKREVEEGKWVLKSSVSQDLAMRAVMLKTGLKQLATSGVGEWVSLVGGDPRRIPDLLRLVLDGFERVLDDYARADGVVLSFTGTEEEAAEEVVMDISAGEAGSPVA